MRKVRLVLVCALLLCGFVVQAQEKPLGQIIASVSYSYDKDGTIKSRAVNGELQRFEYDKKGQLTGVYGRNNQVVEKYSYDPAGNILSKTVDGQTTNYTYDKANQLVSSEIGGRMTNYSYDAAGRLVKEGDKVYNYSYYDKITSVVESGETLASFDYYTDGQIASADYGDRIESFVWDGLALIQRNSSTYLNEPHVNGGSPIASNGKVMLNDLLGTNLGVKGEEFTAINRSAFGETSDKAADNFFTGKPMIGELGYAFLMRNYRADQGKWQTADPLGYPDGFNNFAYCDNGVMERIDTLGLAWGNAEFVAFYYINDNPNTHLDTDWMGLTGQVFNVISQSVLGDVSGHVGNEVRNKINAGASGNTGTTTTSGIYDFGEVCWAMRMGTVSTVASYSYSWAEHDYDGKVFKTYSWSASVVITYYDVFRDPLSTEQFGREYVNWLLESIGLPPVPAIEPGGLPFSYGHTWDDVSISGSGTIE